MRHLLIQALLILSMTFSSSCRNNPLKTNEKELTKEIRLQENQKKEAERIAREKQLSDTLLKIPAGFLYQEDRSVDPAYPPVIIDFSKEIPVREFKLSNIASKVNYLVLKVPDDSVYFSWRTRLTFSSNEIIVNNQLGINRFSRNGRFIETICKNSFVGPRKFDPKGPFGAFFGPETFKGAMDTYLANVRAAGNTVFYKFWNKPGENISLLKYSLNNKTQHLIQPKSSETGLIEANYKGEKVVSGKITRSQSEAPGLFSTNIVPVSDNCYVGLPYESIEKNSYLMFSFNLKGDTLCKFKQFDLLETPITSPVTRVYYNPNWLFGQFTTFKWAFNDTIFRMIPPNRLVPVYVFRFGDYKATAENWLHVNIPQEGKIMINEILENQHFLFIQYYSYVKGKNLMKWGKAIFDKSKNELFSVDLSEKRKNKIFYPDEYDNSWTAGFENDLDGGSPFWPGSVTPDGKLAISLQPEILKKAIISSEYMSGSDSKKKAFAAFVQSLNIGGRQLVIMITE
jgi:hypothetical protein